jgi:hypothetical protein
MVTLWLYSEPTRLGEVAVDASGAFSVTVMIPTDMTPGEHLVQLVGPDADGSLRMLAAGLRIELLEQSAAPDAEAPAAPGDEVEVDDADASTRIGRGRLLALVVLIIGALGGLVVALRRGAITIPKVRS